MNRRSSAFTLLGATGFAFGAHAQAQTPAESARPLTVLLRVESDSVERLRLTELRTGTGSAALLLRSPSSLLDVAGNEATRLRAVLPHVYHLDNSAFPYSANDGALWGGRGPSTLVSAGFVVEGGFFRLIVAPELVRSANRHVAAFDVITASTPLPPDRSPFSSPHFVDVYSVDIPLRFGDEPISRVYPGQSSVTLSSARVSGGIATENSWWGPGIRNALVLSNNAAGFPHAFLRTRRPLTTRLGKIEVRWIVGGLQESAYFDTLTANDLRSLSAAAVTLQPWWNRNLIVGMSRAVYGTTGGWNDLPASAFDVFLATSRSAADSTAPRRAHIYALFGRWVMPASGFEAYAEWGRTTRPESLRDFLLAPNHTHGYTIGVQWFDPSHADAGALRLQGEVTTVEKSPTFRERPSFMFYTNPLVPQGYTHRGEALGAAIGPGSSSQWIAADYVTRAARAGIFIGRIRWHEDVQLGPPSRADCNRDISVFGGGRAAVRTRAGWFSAEAGVTRRLNPYFERGGCPAGPSRHNRTVAVSWSAAAH